MKISRRFFTRIVFLIIGTLLFVACSGSDDQTPFLEDEAPGLANAFPTAELDAVPTAPPPVADSAEILDAPTLETNRAEDAAVDEAYPVAETVTEAVVVDDAYPAPEEIVVGEDDAYPAPVAVAPVTVVEDDAYPAPDVVVADSAEITPQADAYPAPGDDPALPARELPSIVSDIFGGLVFKDANGLYLIDLDGAVLTLMTPPEGVDWAETPVMPTRDMTRVAMIIDGDLAIYDLLSDTMTVPQPTSFQLECCYLEWIDEERVLVGVRENGNSGPNTGVPGIINIANGDITLLTSEINFAKPTLSQDGTMVAMSKQGVPSIVNLEGAELPSGDISSIAKAWSAVWNNDNSKIAWLVLDKDDQMGLSVMNMADGSAEMRHPYTALATEWLPNRPAWQPEGNQIAFETIDIDPSRNGIWMVDAVTGNEQYIAPGSNPHWQPLGKQLAYETPNGIILFDMLNQDYLQPQLFGTIVTWATPPE